MEGRADGCGREGGVGARRCRREWHNAHCKGQVVVGGGQAPEATRMCGGSSDRPSAAGEGQSASGGEGGSKTCGRHVVGSRAEASKERGGM